MKIYKYIGPQILDLIFREEGFAQFKCSYPKDFNDPYELFLTLDPSQTKAEVIAYFLDLLGEIPQLPTTCFSKRPDVIPMWAHYAHQSRGFAIEVDVRKLYESTPQCRIQDISYSDNPQQVSAYEIEHAHQTAKPRHTAALLEKCITNAYFTKLKCWSYEEEIRIAVSEDLILIEDGHKLLNIPDHCIKSIIAGPNTEKKDKEKCMRICNKIQCSYLEMNIGKSTTKPYFISQQRDTLEYNEEQLLPVLHLCETCGEPIPKGKKQCPWCSINQSLANSAAQRNPLRMLSHLGLLDEYLQKRTKESY